MRKKKHTPKGAGIRAREALFWLALEEGRLVELPKPLPVIRF